jgi:repressor LexA
MARKSGGIGERHKKIMQFLQDFQEKYQYAPSIREIGESINVNSTSLVDYYLHQLENMGYIERDQHISRSIRLVKPINPVAEKINNAAARVVKAVEDFLPVPILGRIVASAPIPMPPSDQPYYDYESSIDIARSMLPTRDTDGLFALEVSGDSMIDAMINDGDIVVMKRANDALNGEMVAVWLNDNDETTLKYFYKESNRIRLQPANPTMGPIYVNNPSQVRIMGKVVMVIRQVQPIAA